MNKKSTYSKQIEINPKIKITIIYSIAHPYHFDYSAASLNVESN